MEIGTTSHYFQPHSWHYFMNEDINMEEQQHTYTYLETNGEFKMRELDKRDLEQFNALLQYAFQVTS